MRLKEFNPQAVIQLGPDIYVHKEVILHPHETTLVTVQVPDLSIFPGRGEILPSVRSRFAQVGMNIAPESLEEILEAAKNKEATATISVDVLSERRIKLEEDTNFVRLYEKNKTSFLQGNDLEAMIDTGLVHLTGNKGKDWRYWVPKGESIPRGIELKIDPESRMWIPPRPLDYEPIVLDKASGEVFNYREQLKAALRPASIPPLNNFLGIAHTISEVHMDPSMQGWIDTSLPVYGNRTHINSVLVNGYDTKWKIHTENVIRNGKQPNSVVILFSHAAQYARN